MRTIILPVLLLCIYLSAAQDVPQATIKQEEADSLNLYNQQLELCNLHPVSGFYRDGYCYAGKDDTDTHVVCASMTDEFLKYSQSMGNDLITPEPDYDFPGLVAGDKWCLCAIRWRQAFDAQIYVPVHLESTNKQSLRYATLKQYTTKK